VQGRPQEFALKRFAVTGYTIIAVAAVLAAGLLLQAQAFACPRSPNTPATTPLGHTDASLPRPPELSRPPISVKGTQLIILTGLVFAVAAGGKDAAATLSKNH